MPAEDVRVTAEGLEFDTPLGPIRIRNVDIVVNGLHLPAFTWGWIGLSIGRALFEGAAGLLFNALTQALGLGGPSVEQLLREQLRAIERILRAVVEQEALRHALAQYITTRELMVEYIAEP